MEKGSLMFDLVNMHQSDLEALRLEVSVELDRRRLIDSVKAQTEELVKSYESAVAIEGVVDGTTVPVGGWGPGRTVDFNGEPYVNISGSWLTHDPSEYPHGWRRLGAPDPDPKTAIPWESGLLAKVDVLMTYNGFTWRCKLEHTTHIGWAPSEFTYAVWEKVS